VDLLLKKCEENTRRKEIICMEGKMPIAVLTSKGQMTIPKEVRKALDLKPSGRVIIVVDGDRAVLKPLRGNILDIGGSIDIPGSEKAANFRRIRGQVRKKVARKAARGQ
jgi:AbrB family looped-hinge helix DNA binding protein